MNLSGAVLFGADSASGNPAPLTSVGGALAVSSVAGTANPVLVAGQSQDIDALAVVLTNILAIAKGYGFNGATWDRLRAGADNADAVAAVALGIQRNAVEGFGYNGTTWDRLRVASVASLGGAGIDRGVALQAIAVQWTITHRPAAATKATATFAAGGAGVRHVAVMWSASLANGATASGPINVDLIDGASGGATRLWSGAASAPVSDSTQLAVGPVAVMGSNNTAMTIEFAAAGAAASLETVTLHGFSVS